MTRIFFLFIISLLCLNAKAQSIYRVIVRDQAAHEPLAGVTVTVTSAGPAASGTSRHPIGAISDANGLATLRNLPSGRYYMLLSFTGYKDSTLTVDLPDTVIRTIGIEPDVRSLNDVVVISSTRSNDRIEHATTKVEVLGQAEMNEESTLKPGNIASILGDVSGVQIQQSSAVSGNANVRIQGLDGKYTQILRDGMPLYGGYAGGFGILTIPPLDLKQIELIKGSSSTLYGGGAIAGLVNLISKKPSFTPEASFLVNRSTLKETNINAYYAQRWKRAGFTLFAGENLQDAVDVNKDGFSDVPRTKSTLIHPTFFIYPSDNTWISVGWSGSFEKRTGGDMIAIAGKADTARPYFERNKLDRNILTLLSESRLTRSFSLALKGSFSSFSRNETTNTYLFQGKQNNYYAELSFVERAHKHFLTGGINLTGDRFNPSAATPVPVGEFSNSIGGLFVQDSWQISSATRVEAGLRADHHNSYGNFVLPRIAIFQRLNEHWGLRAGFGTGYSTPNPLTPQNKDYTIYQIKPIGNDLVAERSVAGNAEVNYKVDIGEEGKLFINQSFFTTHINHPVAPAEDLAGSLVFFNGSRPLVTTGSDTYIQMQIPSWEFYLGYTYTDARRKYLPQDQFVRLTPRHRAAATALYEKEGDWRIGLEASYNGHQYREDGTSTPPYVFMALMAAKSLGPKWDVVLNCENLLDVRQSRHEALYTGLVKDPSFNALWAPIDGRVVNLSVRFQPFAVKK